MQKREDLWQNGHDKESKNDMLREGEKYNFQRGGGINIVFGAKYTTPVNITHK